jgi:tetratricopeptide (TPR) repeat protein
MGKLALVMIVKGTADEAPHLQRCLESVSKHVDGIFLNINAKEDMIADEAVIRVAKSFTDNIIETVWTDDFAAARNANLAQVPADYDWVLWLDTDDTVDKPEKIRKVADASVRYDAVYVDYIYDKDEAGNPMTVHMVARLFKNNGAHQWKGRIHETLIETRGVSQGATKDFNVIHHAEEDRKERSLLRNIELLEKQLQDESKDPDPRTFYYLASTYMDCGNLEAAKQLFADYLTLSGWDQERAAAHTKLGRLYLAENNRDQAKQHFMLAIGEDPEDPEPRVEIASLEIEMQQFHKAKLWLEGVEAMEKNMSTLERNPLTYTFRTYLLLADTYLNLGGKHLDKALEYAKKALKYKKKDKNIRNYAKMVENIVRDKHLTEKIVDITRELKKNKEDDKIKLLMQAVPKQLEDNQLIVRLRDSEPYTWPEKSIVIMTGDTALDAWGPWSLKEGIGGSEEAVIRIAPKLRDLGYKVVIFGKPGADAGLHDGVMWRNYWECNLDDNFDIFVAWRAPFIFDKKIKARKAYLWLHDVMEEGEFTPQRIENFHKCILLSDYHRSLFPMIPDEKVLMSGNGIDPEEFVAYDGTQKRDPQKILYASSHVRGLAYLYEIWPEVKKAVPKATLNVYYGRESYDAVHKGNPERMKWMDDMQAKAKELDGVTDHGKVSQAKIVREGFKSGIWAYPCPFPEIYCITAIKSQASGAVPVASNYAALDETIQFGHKQSLGEFSKEDLEQYKESLIWWLKNPKEQEKVRPKMMKWARSKSWANTAKGWAHDFEA